jgi:hypothetical protein
MVIGRKKQPCVKGAIAESAWTSETAVVKEKSNNRLNLRLSFRSSVAQWKSRRRRKGEV